MQSNFGPYAAYGQAQYGAYDASGTRPVDYQQIPTYDPSMSGKLPFARRSSPSPMSYITLAFFIPALIFFTVYFLLATSIHYTNASVSMTFTALGVVAVVFLGIAMVNAWRTGGASGDLNWLAFTFLSSLVALVLAWTLGYANYDHNVTPYMDVLQLNVYPAVDPSTAKGQGLMDAGRMTFLSGAHLDLSKSMGFKNLETYCVAPVTMGNSTLQNYDFWAVGTNCCSGHGADFACGEFDNPSAHSGLRLMREDQRPYFRLAVQEATATHNINARHPIFFHFSQDPLLEIASYQDAATSYLLLGLFVYLAGHLLTIVGAAMYFSKASA